MQTVSYMGDGLTTEFVFNFPYFENSNIIVTKNNAPATDYSIVGNPAGLDADIPYIGGKVVFETAPSLTDSITIARQLPLNRSVDYQPTSKLEPNLLNQDMNYTIELLKDLKDELEILRLQYHDIADKESAQILLAKIEAVTNQIRNFEQEIEQGHIMSKDDFYSYTTNCITEIPQDIKLELNNGVLTLKSGSLIYSTNGDCVSVTSDVVINNTWGSAATGVVFYGLGTGYNFYPIERIHSGSTNPTGLTGNSHINYNTSDNKIYYTSTAGTSWSESSSSRFPIACVTWGADNKITSIDQIFNGFGYIGSTVFVLPGVKGLIPNGRNADGSLNNTKASNTVVHTAQIQSNFTGSIFMGSAGATGCYSSYNYNNEENYNYVNNVRYGRLIAGTVETTDGKITSFSPKKVFSFIQS